MLRRFSWLMAVLLAGALLMDSQTALADPKNEITYRRSTMKALGGHMGALGKILRGRVKKGRNSVVIHARAIGDIGKIAHTLFPKGTDKGRTRALPSIWSKPAEFKKALAAFKKASAKLADVATKGNPKTVMTAYKVVKKTCGTCHKPFRKPRKRRQ